MENNKMVSVSFAAIEKQVEAVIPSFNEKENRGKNYIEWGEDNKFPSYLYGLYTDVTTLRSIINGTTDFVTGDNVESTIESLNKEVNKKGEKLFEIVADMARNYLIYGNAYIQIIRNKAGKVSELYSLSPKYVRSSKKNDIFYYSEDFDKSYIRTSKIIVYPKYVPEATDIATSILPLKTENDNTYGLPIYIASLKDCEVERALEDFNLSQLENGFFPSYLIGLNNGLPSDEVKAEIEKNIQEKFCGASNAGRIILNFADSKENGVTLNKMEIDNYAEKFNTTSERASNKIYESFGASPVLFGVQKKDTGFGDEDYMQSFKLYNRLRVKPIQKRIVALFDKIFSSENTVSIKPFTIDWSDDGDNENKDVKTVE